MAPLGYLRTRFAVVPPQVAPKTDSYFFDA